MRPTGVVEAIDQQTDEPRLCREPEKVLNVAGKVESSPGHQRNEGDCTEHNLEAPCAFRHSRHQTPSPANPGEPGIAGGKHFLHRTAPSIASGSTHVPAANICELRSRPPTEHRAIRRP
jgi:hypothetical protein